MLTHEGRDLAYVDHETDEEGKSVKVFTPVGENQTVDSAIKVALREITDHLNKVSRLITKANKERLEAEKIAREIAAAERERLPDDFLALQGSDTVGMITDISEEDMKELSKMNMSNISSFKIRLGREESYSIFIPDIGIQARLSYRDGGFVITDNKAGLSCKKLNKRLIELRDQVFKIKDPELLAMSIMTLPEPRYSIIAYALSSRYGADIKDGVVNLPNGLSLRFSGQGVNISRDEHHVVHMRFPDGISYPPSSVIPYMPETSKSCFDTYDGMSILKLTEEHYARMGSAWVEAIAEANPDFDPTPFLILDEKRLEDDAGRMDLGYNF